MFYAILALALLVTSYFACRYFLLRNNVRKTAKELQEISQELMQNRVVKLTVPDKDMEQLLEAVNANLTAIRNASAQYAWKENLLKEQIENISHDLRTPLTAVLGYLKMADAENLSAKDQEYLQIAIRKSKTLQDLIEQFYELSRVTSKDFQMELTDVDVMRILRETCLEYYGVFEKSGKQLEIKLLDGGHIIQGNGEGLKRIFGNLLENANRYAKSEICVKAEQTDGKTIRFLFENDIEESLMTSDPDRLFDRFYMQEPHRGHGGTGLGLTICKSLVEHMGGRIEAAYHDDGISCFVVVVEFLVS